jgi:hypothetical protein
MFFTKPSLRKLRRAFKLTAGRSEVVEVNTPEDLIACSVKTLSRPLTMQVHRNLLRMPGGRRLNDRHFFVRALLHGEDELERYYASEQPEDISGFFRVEGKARLGASAEPWQRPWFWDGMKKPSGEKGLGLDQGESYYGPVSDKKRSLEMQRLSKVHSSIRRHGYKTSRFSSGIDGTIFRHGNNAVFLIQGGKHRAAALVAMGATHVPVQFVMTMPRIVQASDAPHFAMVKAGRMDPSLASDLVAAICDGIQD